MPPILEAHGLHRYYGETCAVNDLSFEIEPGEVLGLLGPNGAGKSSTMRMLCGVLAPSRGRVLIDGIDLRDHPERAKRHLGYLPENPPLYPELTVDEYLAFCGRLRGLHGGELLDACAQAKGRCGLADRGRALIGGLSKGYKQRAGIAQAILHSPKVIVLDEPTSGLDPNQVHEVRQLIRDLGRTCGIILSTHILSEVQAVCGRLLILNRGRLAFTGQLGRHDPGRPQSFVVALDEPPPLAELEALPMVSEVMPLARKRFRITLNAGAPPAHLAEALIRWGLTELTGERDGLEQLFARLTLSEAA